MKASRLHKHHIQRWANITTHEGRTMGHVATKVLSDNNVPRRAVSSVELFLDLCGDVLFDGIFLESSGCDLNALLLHLLSHIHVLNDSLGPACRIVFSGAGASVGRCYCVVCHDSEARKRIIWDFI